MKKSGSSGILLNIGPRWSWVNVQPGNAGSTCQEPAIATLPPIARRCPKCGGREYLTEKPAAPVAFVQDRVCTKCLTPYTPPTPPWAAVLFLVIGIPMALVFGAFTIFNGIRTNVCGIAAGALFAAIGILACQQGIRAWNQKIIEPDVD